MYVGREGAWGALVLYIEKLAKAAGMGFEGLAARMNLRPGDLRRRLRSEKAARLRCLVRVADILDVNLDDLLYRKVRLEELARRHQGELELPERYRVGAASKIRTLMPVMNYIVDNHGQRLQNFVLRQLGLNLKLLHDPEIMVSLRLLTDVLEVLRSRGLEESDFFSMGFELTQIPENQGIAKEFAGLESYKEIFEFGVEHISVFYEKNFEYRILSARGDSITLEVKPRPEIQEAFGSELIDTRAVACYRQGVASAHPGYVGLDPALVIERSCVHLGDAQTRFDLRWS